MTKAKTKTKTKPKKAKRARPGQPEFQPTLEQQRDVELFVSARLSEAAIAKEIGISQNTLRKHFKIELTIGREREKARNLRRLRAAADGKNVAAIKELQRMIDASYEYDADLDRPKAGDAATPEQRQPKLGKKEIQRNDAIAAGKDNEWGEDLAPPQGTSVN